MAIVWNEDGYFNLNKLVKKPQPFFLKKEFMIRVVEIANNHHSTTGKYISYEEIVKSGKGRGSVTWCHSGLLDLAIKNSKKKKETLETVAPPPSPDLVELPLEAFLQKKEKKKSPPKKEKKVKVDPVELGPGWDFLPQQEKKEKKNEYYSGLTTPPQAKNLPPPNLAPSSKNTPGPHPVIRLPKGWL